MWDSDLSVPYSQELGRIVQLPREPWKSDPEFVAELSDALGKGTMWLRPIQAQALFELGEQRGLFGAIRVGAGKTLISLLAAVVVNASRPLLLVPAKLIEKTLRDWGELKEHWRIPPIKILSYEWLGRVQAAEALHEINPDLIVADEAHKLRNLKAAVTRRVRRFMSDHPETCFVAMSGTITKRSLLDFAHLLAWCLPPDRVPIPLKWNDLEMWADALDERKGQIKRADPGALQVLCSPQEDKLWEIAPRQAARQAFRRRLVETPGVVATDETPIDASLVITSTEIKNAPEADQAFDRLRERWETPDGHPIADGLGMHRHARELALGFYYIWDPRPPEPWLEARAAWCRFVRRKLARSRTLDSELQVRRAFPKERTLKQWLAIRDTFEPNTVDQWIDQHAIEFCAAWAFEHNGIIWTEHKCFGEMLHALGIPYYGRRGQTHHGSMIEDHPHDRPLAASVQSNAEGRNLQAWSSNLVVSPPPNGAQWEQLLGRTHRDGQQADEVNVEVLVNCAEHVGACWQAVSDARYVQQSTGSPQKLLLADIDIPRADDLAFRFGARWQT